MPGKPCHPIAGRDAAPPIPAGAKAVPSGSPGNTCSHFYQGMLTRQQQLHSESSRPRRRTARPLHLRPQETQVPGTRRRPPSLPGTRREAGTWEERGPTQREGAGVESPPPTQTCISSPSSGRRSGGGRGAGGEEGRRGRWRARRGGVELIGALSAGFALGRGGQEEKGFLRGASFILPARSLLMKPSTWGLSPQQGSEEQTPPALRANTRGSGRSGAGSRRSPPPPTSQPLPLPAPPATYISLLFKV